MQQISRHMATARWRQMVQAAVSALPVDLTRDIRRRCARWRENGYRLHGLGSVSVGGLFAAILLYATSISGDLYTFTGTLTHLADRSVAHAGFAIRRISITGDRQLSKAAIRDQLGVSPDNSLVLFDAARARQRLYDLPWVQDASIQKFYPDRLHVTIREYTPFAVWRRPAAMHPAPAYELAVISRSGRVLERHADIRFLDLPRVSGAGSNERAFEIIDRLASFPHIGAVVASAEWITGRRWDLHLASGTVIRLPEDTPDAALHELERLRRHENILERAVESIDFRLADRIVVRLDEATARARRGAQQKRLDRLKQRNARAI